MDEARDLVIAQQAAVDKRVSPFFSTARQPVRFSLHLALASENNYVMRMVV